MRSSFLAEETRMNRILFSAAAGAAAMYFLDPQAGRRRRARTRDKAERAARRLQDAYDVTLQAARGPLGLVDRKSTRLNSSHSQISYAGFCLKKKTEPKPRVAVITFPGSNDDHDAALALTRLGAEAVPVWHADRELPDVRAVVLPGGFSYGDYLRAGALARFAPVMEAVRALAADGGLVLGICNGFQVLCQAGLLP